MSSNVRRFLSLILVVTAAVLAGSDRAQAVATVVRVDTTAVIPYGGAFSTGVVTTAALTNVTTSVPVSDATGFKGGLVILIDSEKMEVTGVSGDGPGGAADSLTVTRSAPVVHLNNRSVSANVMSFDVRVDNLQALSTGMTLNAALGAGGFEDSGATLLSDVNAGDTLIKVNDASLLDGGTSMRLRALTSINATNKPFLGSGGRTPSCEAPVLGAAATSLLCYTTGALGSGATGSGLLATVRLRGDAPGAYALNLTDVVLTDATINVNQIPVSQLVGARVVVGTDPPPAPTPPAPTSGVRLYLSPSDQTVPVGQEFDVNVYIENVTNLGSYQITVERNAGEQQLNVVRTISGYLDNNGIPWNQGVSLTGNISAAATTIPVNSPSVLKPGWVALIGSEQMVVTATGASTVDVLRGFRGTSAASHDSGATVYAGPERVEVNTGAAYAQIAGAPVESNAGIVKLNDASLLGDQQDFLIDSEYVRVVQAAARQFGSPFGTLSFAINPSATNIQLSGSVSLGDLLAVNGERMLVTALTPVTVVRGFGGTPAASHAGGAPISRLASVPNAVRALRARYGSTAVAHSSGAALLDADGLGAYLLSVGSQPGPSGAVISGTVDGSSLQITVNDGSKLQPGWTVLIDTERLLVQSIAGNVVTVTRGRDGTFAVGHTSGSTVYGPVVIDVVTALDAGWLGSTGRTATCSAPLKLSYSVALSCSSSGTSPGPLGSSAVFRVRLSAKGLVAGHLKPPISFLGSGLSDTSGDAFPHSTQQGLLKIINCPDVDDDTLITFPGDIMRIANAYFGLIPSAPAYDIDLDGLVTFPGDVLGASAMYFGNGPARCLF